MGTWGVDLAVPACVVYVYILHGRLDAWSKGFALHYRYNVQKSSHIWIYFCLSVVPAASVGAQIAFGKSGAASK